VREANPGCRLQATVTRRGGRRRPDASWAVRRLTSLVTAGDRGPRQLGPTAHPGVRCASVAPELDARRSVSGPRLAGAMVQTTTCDLRRRRVESNSRRWRRPGFGEIAAEPFVTGCSDIRTKGQRRGGHSAETFRTHGRARSLALTLRKVGSRLLISRHRKVKPVLSEQLGRVHRPDGAISASHVASGTVLVAAPARALGMSRSNRYFRHDRYQCRTRACPCPAGPLSL
jgi:hypothetical protein